MKLTRVYALAAAAIWMIPGTAPAQNRPDPEQIRQRMSEFLRQQFDVTDDAEWKLIAERIEKVSLARRATMSSFGGFGGGARPPGAGGDAAVAPDGAGAGAARSFFSREADPDLDALRKAIEAKAGPEEIRTKLTKLREARKDKEARLEKAQEELRQVLSVRQEALAVMFGLLK